MNKKFASFVMALAILASAGMGSTSENNSCDLIPSTAITASAAFNAPYLNGSNYIIWYCDSGRTEVFTTSSLCIPGSSAYKNGSGTRNYSAYIAEGDKCFIYKVTDSYAFVGYPVGSTYRYGYIPAKCINKGYSSSWSFKSLDGGISTYNNIYLNSRIGSIDKGDSCYLLSYDYNYDRYQVIYSLTGSSNYKIGWLYYADFNRIAYGFARARVRVTCR